MEHRTRSILFISAQLYERKLILWSLDTNGCVVEVKKEIRVSREVHPIPVRRIKQEEDLCLVCECGKFGWRRWC
jgi:hypothetical protein